MGGVLDSSSYLSSGFSEEVVVQEVRRLLEPYLATMDAFLVDVEVYPSGLLRVYVDTDAGITIDQCSEIARYLREHLQDALWAEEIDRIEVSSPGIDRPFRTLRQYQKYRNWEVEVLMHSGERYRGVLLHASLESVVLRVSGRDEPITLPFQEVKETRLVLRF